MGATSSTRRATRSQPRSLLSIEDRRVARAVLQLQLDADIRADCVRAAAAGGYALRDSEINCSALSTAPTSSDFRTLAGRAE